MYKKFIVKRGTRIGPYFYTSVRLKNGAVKSLYLGNNEILARRKERLEQRAAVVRGK